MTTSGIDSSFKLRAFLASAGRRATFPARPQCNEQTCPPGETALYRHLVFLCSTVITVLCAAPAARATDSERCQGLSRRFEETKPQITAIEMSLTLFSAVDANCIDLVTKLLDQGASLDARDRLGARPLSRAARSGHLQMVDFLLARGAPIDARNLAGATALYFAAEGGHTPIVQRLIERGADVKLAGRLVLCHRPDEPRREAPYSMIQVPPG